MEYYEVTEKDFELTEQEIMHDAYRSYDQAVMEDGHDKGLEKLFNKYAFADEFKELRWLEKPFYWFKTFVCLCLWRITRWDYADINVVYFDERPYCGEYYGTEWETIAVKKGFFKNWYVAIYSDSSC